MNHAFSFKNTTRTQLRRFSLSTLLALFLAPILAFAASGIGSVGGALFKSKSDIITNATDNYKNALTANVTLESSGNGCILVRFTANLLVVDNGDTSAPAPAAQFKASVSGQQMKPGVLLYTDTGDVLYSNFAGEWWRCGLAGNGTSHNIKIKYRRRSPQSDDDTVQIRERTLTAELN